MKLLRILIYNFLAGMFLLNISAKAQNPSLRIGVYDFTGMAASEIYILAPTVQVGFPILKCNRLSIDVLPAFSYNSRKYIENFHRLYMVPFLFSVNYQANNPGKNVFPVVSSGISFLGKADHNYYMEKSIYSFTYGFHVSAGLRFLNKNKSQFSITLTYNLFIPPVMEKINPSGMLIMFGYHFKGNDDLDDIKGE